MSSGLGNIHVLFQVVQVDSRPYALHGALKGTLAVISGKSSPSKSISSEKSVALLEITLEITIGCTS